MALFLQFVIDHWPLWLLFVGILVAIVVSETNVQLLGVKLITTSQLTELLNREQGVVVDVRDASAFATGSIAGSLNIPADALMSKLKKLQKYREKPVILVCADGRSTPALAKPLMAENFSRVFVLRGGIASWSQDELPLEV